MAKTRVKLPTKLPSNLSGTTTTTTTTMFSRASSINNRRGNSLSSLITASFPSIPHFLKLKLPSTTTTVPTCFSCCWQLRSQQSQQQYLAVGLLCLCAGLLLFELLSGGLLSATLATSLGTLNFHQLSSSSSSSAEAEGQAAEPAKKAEPYLSTTTFNRRKEKELPAARQKPSFEKRAFTLLHQLELAVQHVSNQSNRAATQQRHMLYELQSYTNTLAEERRRLEAKGAGMRRNRTYYPPRVGLGECPPTFGRVGILVLYMKEDEYTGLYHVAQQSLRCYLATTNYTYYAVNLLEDPLVVEKCSDKWDTFFRKHCAASVHLRHRLRGVVDWLLVTDADSGVVYPGHCLEEWIDDRVELIFYERFFNWEIASGNYLVRNTDYAADFLMAWADWLHKLPSSYHGTDNGAIHMHILQTVLPEAENAILACQRIWERATYYDTYMAYVTCVKLALGANRLFPEAKLRIYRRAHAWVRDGWMIEQMWSEHDFMIHGWKMQTVDKWPFPFERDFDLEECAQGNFSGWHWREERRRPTDEIRGHLEAAEKRQQAAFEPKAKVIPFLIEPEIGECYPHCDDKT